MKGSSEIVSASQLRSEAATWVAKLDAGSLTAKDLAALRAWAQQTPRHRQALDEAASSWDDLNILSLYRDAIAGASQRQPKKYGVAIAAGLVALVVVAGLMLGRPSITPQSAALMASNGNYETAIGEQRLVTLPDGSVVRLNTASHLQVNYSEEQRSIHLQRGEAYFEVASNKQQPFVVHTGDNEVIAVGTAFAVMVESPSRVKVTVSEGRVRVAALADGQAADKKVLVDTKPSQTTSEELVSGQVALLSPSRVEHIETIDLPEMESSLAWRTGMLSFNGDSLDQVIAEIGRYTSTEVVIADPALNNLKIGGYFRVGDVDVLLATLESDFGVMVDRADTELIQLRKQIKPR